MAMDPVRGIALATDGNGRFTQLDPYHGAQLSLAEAYRNVACTGARPLAVTNCLNFGSPEDPNVMWQFSHAVRGLADGCLTLGVPVTGGNVSFYNQTGHTAILPTPVIGVLGVIDDVSKRLRSGFRTDGARIYLLGQTRDELDGSAWAQVMHDHLGGRPPKIDLTREKVIAAVLHDAAHGRPARFGPRRLGRGPGPDPGRELPERRRRRHDHPAAGPRPVRVAVLRIVGARRRQRQPRARG